MKNTINPSFRFDFWTRVRSMVQGLRQRVTSSSPLDPIEKPRERYEISMLHITVALISLTCIVLLAYFWIFPPSNGFSGQLRISAILATILIAQAGIFTLSRFGHHQLALKIELTLLFLMLAYGTFMSGGLYATSALIFFLLLLMSGTILNNRYTILVGIYVIAYLVAIYLIEINGVLPEVPLKDLPYRLTMMIVLTVLMVAILVFHRNTLHTAELKRLELQVTAERLKTQQQLTQDLAHDLRTPITALNTSLFLLKMKQDAGHDVAKEVVRLENSSKKLQAMVDGFIELSGLDNDLLGAVHRLEEVDLSALLSQVIDGYRSMADKANLNLIFDSAEPILIHGRTSQLERVFDNLISNAIHYGHDGESVIVTMRTEEQFATVSIADQGQGIAAEDHARIFERFYRVNKARTGSAHTGTGIGLAICKRIVENHGGQIELESDLGQGSTFSVRLPLL